MGPLENRRNNPLESELNNPAIEPVCKQYAELRYRLLPYTYTLTWEARNTGMPLMRAMWLHYPEDGNAKDMGDQYLWGRDLLVAPVYTKGATSRKVYLPEGEWYDWWTLKKENGGQSILKEVDMSIMPIYVRSGAILPLDPIRQYTDQAVEEPITIRIYSGADGQFIWYEDDGISLEYLQGKASTTNLTWDNKERIFTIEPGMSGAHKAKKEKRVLFVELLPEGEIRKVTYREQIMKLEF